MKRYLAPVCTILAILIGLLGLNAPLITDAIIAIGVGGFLDPALLQPLFIGFVIIALYGYVTKVKETMAFLPLILVFVFGVVGFLFIFPFQNQIVGYLALLGFVFILVWPFVSKQINKKNIKKIKV